ncbi:hypothetical protein DIPPA_09034 [Diplonema papillatum]|nr:hypothetical protein DIPPA_09034 [Diplonema papillatum]
MVEAPRRVFFVDAATRVAVVDVELGYKWQYQRWNVIVAAVWVERTLVDAPPTAALW